jgi:hypothetical protein
MEWLHAGTGRAGRGEQRTLSGAGVAAEPGSSGAPSGSAAAAGEGASLPTDSERCRRSALCCCDASRS